MPVLDILKVTATILKEGPWAKMLAWASTEDI